MPADAIITVLAITLLGTGWALSVLPVATCAQCPHCAQAKVVREREAEGQVSGSYGIPLCPACGRHHQRGEDHPR